MNGKQSKKARKLAHAIRRRYQSQMETWPWYKRMWSWIFPKLGERWAAREIEELDRLDDYRERRIYSAIKRGDI